MTKNNQTPITYNIGDQVYYRTKILGTRVPGKYTIMSHVRRDRLGRRYYLTRYNKKDYLHGLPNRKTKRIYKKRIEYKIESDQNLEE